MASGADAALRKVRRIERAGIFTAVCAILVAFSTATLNAMKRIERIRLYPTPHQETSLAFMLDVTRQLYNALLEQRRDAYRKCKITLSAKQQSAELTALRADDLRVRAVYRECEDAALHRLELAYRAFFRRLKCGQSPGFPRFKSHRRWDQLEFPHGNRALKFDASQRKVRVPGVGWVKLRKGRAVPVFGRAWVVRRNARWYACFECERVVREDIVRSGGVLGIDRGVHVLAATSDGRLFANPRPLQRLRTMVERCQRAVSRKKRGGKNRRKAIALLGRLHERITNVRRDALHKVSRRIVDSAPTVIGIENLRVTAMTRSAKGTLEFPGRNVRAKSGLNRVILDASFGLLRQMIGSKAEEAGIAIVAVDPKYSSQTCSQCGHVAAESRRKRRFACVACGFMVHADVNAALEIRRRAQSVPAGRGVALANLDDPRSANTIGEKPVTLNAA
jgi:putative transposase